MITLKKRCSYTLWGRVGGEENIKREKQTKNEIRDKASTEYKLED